MSEIKGLLRYAALGMLVMLVGFEIYAWGTAGGFHLIHIANVLTFTFLGSLQCLALYVNWKKGKQRSNTSNNLAPRPNDAPSSDKEADNAST